MYRSPTARVITPGRISEPIRLHRGTRQGCLLSPLLFNLALEPLLKNMIFATEMKGIRIREEEIKIALCADDVLMFIINPDPAIDAIHKTLETFGAFAGFRVNYDKSEILPLNTHSSS